MQLAIVAEDNWILSGMVPHIGAICPTDLSTAALANCNPTLNTDWLVVHSPYVSLHLSAMKMNLLAPSVFRLSTQHRYVLYTYSWY